MFAIAAAAVAALCFRLVPESVVWLLAGAGVAPELFLVFLQTCLAAAAMAAIYVLSGGFCFDAPDTASTDGRIVSDKEFPMRRAMLIVLGVAAIVGVAKVLVQGSGFSATPAALAMFVVMLVATGVFEEVLFRGLLFEGFARSFVSAGTRGNAVLTAAIATSVLFGILHVSSDLGSLFRVTAYVEAAAKIAECALFGMIMCAISLRVRSIWPCAALHAMFDILSETPIFATTGVQTSTYLTGSPADLAVVAGAALLLVLPAKWAADCLKATELHGTIAP